MQLPSILQGESLTRLLQGAAAGAVATMFVGFYWGGWSLGSKRRPRRIREMPRYRVVLRAFAGWPVETGLAGWGGRIRTSAFRIGSGGPSRLGPTPNSFIQADETRTPPFGKSSKELQKRLAFYVEQSVSVAGR